MTDTDKGGTERDWSDHWPTGPKLTSGMRDGFTLTVNGTQVFFKARQEFPMLVEISLVDEAQVIGSINTARGDTVTLGGIDEGLAKRVDEIRELPVEEMPAALEYLAYRLNPAGREEPDEIPGVFADDE